MSDLPENDSAATPNEPLPGIVDRAPANHRHLKLSLGSLFLAATGVAVFSRLFAALPSTDRVLLAALGGILLLITLPGLARAAWRCFRPPEREFRAPPRLMEELLSGAFESMTALKLAIVVGAIVVVGLEFPASLVGLPFSESVIRALFALAALAAYMLVFRGL